MKCILCGKETKMVLTLILRGGTEGKVEYCIDCDFGMLNKDVDEKSLKDFYKNEYRNNALYKESESPHEMFDIYSKFQKNRVDVLKPYINKDTRLLEVGCSVGMFLYHIRNYVKEVVGVDYDTKSACFAAKKCQCPVFDKDIKDLNLKKGSFDVVCAFQTLEHVADPVKFIKELASYLKKDGIIYIEVPNTHSILLELYALPNYEIFHYHPAHLWYFSEISLKKVMSKAGFKGEIKFIEGYNLFNHINWLNNDTPQKGCIAGKTFPPHIPLRKNSSISEFFALMDEAYRHLLGTLKMTSDIHYIGKKR